MRVNGKSHDTNFKINLIDIIPKEIYGDYDQENRCLVNGFINEIANSLNLICHDSVIDVILMYYPQFLYF